MPLVQLRLPEEYNKPDADFANCEEFWLNLQFAMLVRGILDRNITDVSDQTNLLEWNPMSDLIQEVDQHWLTQNIGKSGPEQSEAEKECRLKTLQKKLVELFTQSTPRWSKTASMKGHNVVWGNICGPQREELHCN